MRGLANALKLSFGLAVSFGCLWFATRGTDWTAVGAVLRGANPLWVFGIVVVGVASLAIRARRWQVLLRPLGRVPLVPALSATAIGFGAGVLLPLRLGEIVRPALLSRRCRLPLSGTVSSVVLERVFDMMLVIGCFLIVGLVYPLPDTMRQAARVLGVGSVLGLVALVIVLRHRVQVELLVQRWLPARVAKAIAPLLHGFLAGFTTLADAGTVVTVVGYSVLLWGVIALGWTFSFLALGIDVPLLAASLIAMVTVAAFVFLPQGPGFVGTWQAGCILALDLFRAPKDQAVGFALLSWIAMMGTNLLVGGLFLAREDLSVRQLLRTAGSERTAA